MAASRAASQPLPPIFFDNGTESDEFGEFEFASVPPPPIPAAPLPIYFYTNYPLQPPQLAPVVEGFGGVGGMNDEDDEWGDFVESPLSANPASSPSPPSSFDAFPDSPPIRPEVEGPQEKKKGWEKPKGAIPLSIFGEDEEEPDPASSPPPPPAQDLFFSPVPKPARSHSGMSAPGVGIRDLLADLYGQADKLGGSSGNGGTEDLRNGVSGDLGGNDGQDDDFDETCWEFQGVSSEVSFGDSMNNQVQVVKSEGDILSQSSPFEVTNSNQDMGDRHAEHDIFPNAFDSFMDVATHTDSIPNGYSGTAGIMFKNSFNPNLTNGGASFDKKQHEAKEEQKLDDLFCTKAASNMSSDNFLDFGDIWERHTEDFSVSTPSNGREESLSHLNTQNELFDTSEKIGIDGINPASTFNDLLFNLYEEAGHTATVDFSQNSENVENSAQLAVNLKITNSEVNNFEEHLDEPKPFIENGVKDQSSVSIGTDQASHATSEPKDFVDFYSELKDTSRLFALHHLNELEKAHKIAILASDEARAMELHLEIRSAFSKLQDEAEDSKNTPMDECFLKNISFDGLRRSLSQSNFEALELEYLLLKKMLLAEKDLRSAIHLLEHARLVLDIFNSCSWEEQQNYITAWSKMLSACEKELQHGAMIWAQCLQIGVHKQILSEPRGYEYFLALGEIRRVAEILNSSFAVYKPWILLNPIGSKDLLNRYKRCSQLWTDSGLGKALEDIPDQVDLEKQIRALLESTNFIHNLDVAALQSRVSGHEEPVCQLSRLPLHIYRDVKAVVWNGHSYFVGLANLWANLVSPDLPELRHRNAG